MHTFRIFVGAVVADWWARTGAILTVVGLIGLLTDKPPRVSVKWFLRSAVLLLLISCYSAWRSQYWSTQGWTKSNGELAAKVRSETQENAGLSLKIGELQMQLAAKEKPITLAVRSAPAPKISQQSRGDNSPNIVGNQNQVTINPGAPPRKLTDEQLSMLKTYASAYPAKIRIFYQLNDSEGYAIGKQIADTLTQSGWALTEPINGVITVSAVPLFGMQLSWKGDAVGPGAQVAVTRTTPQGALCVVLSSILPGDFTVRPLPDMETDTLQLDIYANPAAKSK